MWRQTGRISPKSQSGNSVVSYVLGRYRESPRLEKEISPPVEAELFS
jgi:hypothetical protein